MIFTGIWSVQVIALNFANMFNYISILCVYPHSCKSYTQKHTNTLNILEFNLNCWCWVNSTGNFCVPKHTIAHAYMYIQRTKEREILNSFFKSLHFPRIRRDISIWWKFWSHTNINAQYSTYYTCIYNGREKMKI